MASKAAGAILREAESVANNLDMTVKSKRPGYWTIQDSKGVLGWMMVHGRDGLAVEAHPTRSCTELVKLANRLGASGWCVLHTGHAKGILFGFGDWRLV